MSDMVLGTCTWQMGKLSDLQVSKLVSDTHLLKIQMKTFMDTESQLWSLIKEEQFACFLKKKTSGKKTAKI